MQRLGRSWQSLARATELFKVEHPTLASLAIPTRTITTHDLRPLLSTLGSHLQPPTLPHSAAHAALLPPLSSRGFASQQRAAKVPKGAYSAPAGMGERGSNMRITMIASNVIAEPYKGDPPSLPLSAWFTPSGWKQRWNRWMGSFKSVYTLSKVKKNVPGWKLPTFKEEALEIYTQVCSALAAGDRTALRHLVAPSIFTDMKRQIKQREDGGWKKVEWNMSRVPALNEIELVHCRLIAADPKNDDTAFAQLTLKFKSGQTFAAYDARGKIVAGSKDAETQVVDYWMFERPLKQQQANKWRVAGRLAIPPPSV